MEATGDARRSAGRTRTDRRHRGVGTRPTVGLAKGRPTPQPGRQAACPCAPVPRSEENAHMRIRVPRTARRVRVVVGPTTRTATADAGCAPAAATPQSQPPVLPTAVA